MRLKHQVHTGKVQCSVMGRSKSRHHLPICSCAYELTADTHAAHHKASVTCCPQCPAHSAQTHTPSQALTGHRARCQLLLELLHVCHPGGTISVHHQAALPPRDLHAALDRMALQQSTHMAF